MDPVPDVNAAVAVATAMGSLREPQEAVLYSTDLLAPERVCDLVVQAPVVSPTCRAGSHRPHTTRHHGAWKGEQS